MEKLRKAANLKVSSGFAYTVIFAVAAFVIVILYAKQPDLAFNDPKIVDMRERQASAINEVARDKQLKKIDTDVHLAIKHKRFEALNSLLNDPKNRNKLDTVGNTPLHAAIRLRSEPALKALIQSGADLNRANKLGDTPLHASVSKNFVEAVDLLVQSGANVNGQDRHGNTPLMLVASRRSDNTLLEKLIEAGTNTYVKNNKNQTVYSLILRTRNPENLLLFPDVELSYLNQALLLALRRSSTDLASKFIDRGANPFLEDDETANQALAMAIHKHPLTLVKRLIENAGDYSFPASKKFGDPLLEVMGKAYFDVAQTMLDAGAKLKDSGSEMRLLSRVLSIKSRSGREEGFHFLVNNGIDLATETPYRNSYLMLAAKQGRHRIVQLLLDAGANVNHLTRMQTPFSLASKGKTFGHIMTVGLLKLHGAIEDPLHVLRQQNGVRDEVACEVGQTLENLEVNGIDIKRATRKTVSGTFPSNPCFYWGMACAHKRGEIDNCMRSAPLCGNSSDPQVCCPADCYTRYREARCAGLSPEKAFVWLFKENPQGCKL